MPRALFITSQFFTFAGSELTVLEMAEELISRGWDCSIKAAIVGSPLAYQAFSKGVAVSSFVSPININEYDLVWSQHGTLAAIDYRNLRLCADRPFIVSAHLSPHTSYEQLIPAYANEFIDLVVANSTETKMSMPEWLKVEIVVNNNCASGDFFFDRKYNQSIENILCISNHLPGELSHVLLHYERDLNVNVVRIGRGSEVRRVKPSDLNAADVVISIGKSVQYALASKTPVYVYDHFGGDGWVDRQNLASQAAYNFSGRPNLRKRSSSEIFQEIIDGYQRAVEDMSSVSSRDIAIFDIRLFVNELVRRYEIARRSIEWSNINFDVLDVVRRYAEINFQDLKRRYRLEHSDIWSAPSFDRYFDQI